MPLVEGRATVVLEVFGISFTELVVVLVVALVVLGPQRLPGMLRTIGLWIHKVRQMTTEVRAQTGIDDLLRQEGFSGGLAEVRALLRGDARPFIHPDPRDGLSRSDDPYDAAFASDASRERPVEGPDAYGALADDLVDEEALLAAQQQALSHVEAPERAQDASENADEATNASPNATDS